MPEDGADRDADLGEAVPEVGADRDADLGVEVPEVGADRDVDLDAAVDAVESLLLKANGGRAEDLGHEGSGAKG